MSSCWLALRLLVLVHADWTRPHAHFEASNTILGKRCGRAAYILGPILMGGDSDKRVSDLPGKITWWVDEADDDYRGGPLIRGPLVIKSDYMNTAYSALTGLNVIIGLFSSLAVNMPDFGRFSKNRLAGPHQFLALPIIGTLGALTPIFVTDAHSYLWGEFEWYVTSFLDLKQNINEQRYMPAVIAKFDSRAAKFFVSASFILATIGNQVAAGTYPFSNVSTW
jgi:hypothetical protein